jgi:hypothetical protein
MSSDDPLVRLAIVEVGTEAPPDEVCETLCRYVKHDSNAVAFVTPFCECTPPTTTLPK